MLYNRLEHGFHRLGNLRVYLTPVSEGNTIRTIFHLVV